MVVTQSFKNLFHYLRFDNKVIQHISTVSSVYISFCSNATAAFDIKGFAMNVTVEAEQAEQFRPQPCLNQLAAAYVTTDHM